MRVVYIFLLVFSFLGKITFGQFWEQLGSDIIGESSYHYCGYTTSCNQDGTVIAVSSVGAIGSAGKVRVFNWSGSSWTQMGSGINGESTFDNLGASVAISHDGKTIVCGANEVDDAGDRAGQAVVYQWDGSTWVKLGENINGEGADDWFGSDVAITGDGSRIIVGAVEFDINFTWSFGRGYASVFDWDGTGWVQIGETITGDGDGDRFGYTVDINDDGNRIVIGAPNNDAMGVGAGQAKVYDLIDGEWVQAGEDLDDGSGSASTSFGTDVSLSNDGNRLAIGLSGDDSFVFDAGSIRSYFWNGTSWEPVGEKMFGLSFGDALGFTVQSSGNGKTLVAGANFALGEAGQVRVFNWNGIEWSQIGEEIDGMSGEFLGRSSAISGDGLTVLAAGPFGDLSGVDDGVVRVYRPTSLGTIENDINPFRIYPNPATDILNVSFALNNSEQTQVNVLDISGKVINQVNLGTVNGKTNVSVSLEELSKGVYFIELVNSEGKQVKKFVKK